MFEVSFAGEYHCDAVFVSGGDDFIVLIRAARLDYCGHTCFGGIFDIIREGEECI